MSATSPFVGVRVFSDLRGSVASIDTRDSTVIGMALPLPNILPADEALFPLDEPVRIATDDPVLIAKLGPGVAADTIEQINGPIVCFLSAVPSTRGALMRRRDVGRHR